MDDHDGHTATYWGPTTVKVVAQQHHVAHLVRRGEPPHLHPVQPLLRVEALITGIMARRTGFIQSAKLAPQSPMAMNRYEPVSRVQVAAGVIATTSSNERSILAPGCLAHLPGMGREREIEWPCGHCPLQRRRY